MALATADLADAHLGSVAEATDHATVRVMDPVFR
jgi:hypothetical protein